MRGFWEHEARRVLEAYPTFESRARLPRPRLDPYEATRCGAFVRTWYGIMQPFRPELDPREMLAIIADLYDDGDILVSAGSLRHDTRCSRAHGLDPALVPQRAVTDMFEVELAYCVPPARPVVRSMRPFLSLRQYPDMPHPIAPLNSLCISYAPTDAWSIERDGAVLYLDWTAIYLAKHALWREARERNGAGRAAWPGTAMSYDPGEELKAPPTAPCSCGSERRYDRCHRAVDERNSARTRRGLELEPRSFAPLPEEPRSAAAQR